MAIEMPKRKIVFIDSAPPINENLDRFCWVDTVSRTIKTYVNGQWTIQADLSDPTTGVTGEIKVANAVFTFKNGLLDTYSIKE